MNSIIKCNENRRGQHNFYINYAGKDYYLFSQDYHDGVNKYFSKGVSIHNIFDTKRNIKDHCVMKTVSKMKPYIRYIEKEYDLMILKETIEKVVINKKKKHLNKNSDNYDYNYNY